jgi:crotonobetainyl-CoA:carnitine CoA-transferase CaiB-like acyl-CoA transferase
VHTDETEVTRDPAGSYREGQLSDLLVIDLSRAVAGPHAAMMLGDLGARVIKVEQPGQGDDARSWGPPFVEGSDGKPVSTYFLAANRNKESITLDLKDTDDMLQLRQLLVKADVLIENFRPGTLTRLGLTDQALLALNARLVVLAISGFGHDGPEGGRAGYDQIAQGEAGLMSVTGSNPDDPQRVGVPIADILAGVYGAYGVLAALHERIRTGRGQIVRTSLLAAVVASHGYQGTAWTVAGARGQARGNHHPSIAPYGLFRCGDGAVQIACGNDSQWQTLSTVFGLDVGAGLATNRQRVDGALKSSGYSKVHSLRSVCLTSSRASERQVSRPGGYGESTRFMRGSRPSPRDSSSTFSMPHLGRSSCPAHRSASSMSATRQKSKPPSSTITRRRCWARATRAWCDSPRRKRRGTTKPLPSPRAHRRHWLDSHGPPDEVLWPVLRVPAY